MDDKVNIISETDGMAGNNEKDNKQMNPIIL